MADPQVRVVGLNELRRDLRRLDSQWAKELAKANNAAAEIVAQEARRRAPAGPHQGGGRVTPINQSIRANKAQRSASVSIGGARTPHAAVTEFGGSIPRAGPDKAAVALARERHRSFASVGVKSRTKVLKRAYLYPAIAAKTDEVVETYVEMLDDLMREAFRD